MDYQAFRKYIEERKKIEKELGDIKPLEEKYVKYKEVKDKSNSYARQWHKERMESDEEYKEKRKILNKQSYERLKSKRESKKQIQPSDSENEEEELEQQIIEEPKKKTTSRMKTKPITNQPIKKQEKPQKQITKEIIPDSPDEEEEDSRHVPIRKFTGLGI